MSLTQQLVDRARAEIADGITVTRLAQELGITRAGLHHLLSGTRRPDARTVDRLAERYMFWRPNGSWCFRPDD